MAGTVAADPELERFSRNKESVTEEEQVFTPPPFQFSSFEEAQPIPLSSHKLLMK